MVNGPINSGDKDPAQKGRDGSYLEADEHRFLALLLKALPITSHGDGKSNMDQDCQNQNSEGDERANGRKLTRQIEVHPAHFLNAACSCFPPDWM